MFYSDKPISTVKDDKLKRNGFATLLANALTNMDDSDTFTVGLFGKWGCGKTSLVNMALAKIEELQAGSNLEKQIIVVHFEPWNFTDTNQLLTQFFVRLANEFQEKDDKNLTKIGKALEDYSDAFGLLELIPGVGAPIASVGKWGISRLGQKMQKGLDERDVLKQKEQVISLLKNQSNRILVVIDDIDRLSNEQIRYIFQLITSVARFPNTTYLLVFDKEIVVEALKDVQGGNGEEYLEKVIQMPIQIPDITRSDLHEVLSERLNEIKKSFPNIGFDLTRWPQIFRTCVDPFIVHLRDVNRLCNTLRFKLAAISSEVDFVDMIAISVLDIHHPLVYKWVKENKAVLTGENDYGHIVHKKSPSDLLTEYHETFQKLTAQERCSNNGTGEADLIIAFLADLFPYFGSKIGKGYEVYNASKAIRNNLIAHPNKFDRYFQLNVDALPFKTADVDNLAFLMDEKELAAFMLAQAEKGTVYELLENIAAHVPDLTADRAKSLISALCKVVYSFEKIYKSFLSVSAASYAELMLLDLLEQIPADERAAFISSLIADADIGNVHAIATMINMLELGYGRLAAEGQERNYKKVITIAELIDLETIFTARVKELLKSYSLFNFAGWNIIFYLMNSFDKEYMKNYLETALFDDENVLKLLCGFIIVWTGSGKEYQIQDEYKDYLTDERALEAIYACQRSGAFSRLPEEMQNQCAAFILSNSGKSRRRDRVYQNEIADLAAALRA